MRLTIPIRLLLPVLLAGSVTRQTLGQEPSVVELMTSARTALAGGDLDGARASLERVLSREGVNKPARLALTDVLMRLGLWNEAEKQAQILTAQFPADTEPVFLLARIALRRGDARAARGFAARCLDGGDSRPDVYKLLAVAEYLLQEKDKFETHIKTVLERNPRDAEAQYILARYLYENKRYSESLKTFQIVLQLEPDHYKAHYYCGLLYGSSGEGERARAEFLRSIEIVERKKVAYAWPYADLGKTLTDAAEPDKAIEWLARGVRNDANCPKVYYEYARALFQAGHSAEVKQALLEAVRLDPGYTEAYYLLARYYKKSGESQAADQVLSKFRDLKNHPIASPYGLPRQ